MSSRVVSSFPPRPGGQNPRASRSGWPSPGLSTTSALRLLLLMAVCIALLAVPVLPAAGEESPRWSWPLSPEHEVVTRFDPGEHAYSAGHRGIDVKGSGSDVLAVEAGTVRFAGMVAGRPVLSVLHDDGLISTYEPVRPLVSAGESVAQGEVIGELLPGHPGCPGTCLHLGARRGQDGYQDPLPLLGALGPSVLLPIGGGTAGGSRGIGTGPVPRPSSHTTSEAAPPPPPSSPAASVPTCALRQVCASFL